MAKQDTSSSIQVVQEKPTTEENTATLQSSPKTEIEEPSISEAAPAATEPVETHKNDQKTEVQLETSKEEKLAPEDSKNSNRNSEAIVPKEEVGEDKSVTAHESQSTVSEQAKAEDTTGNSKEEPSLEITETVKDESHVEGNLPKVSKDEEDELVEGENEEGEIVEDEEGEEVEGEHEEEEIVEGEREEGDGEESDEEDTPAKPLDDDEDRRNPQYIPKRGGFYEHDDRNREEVEEAAA